MEGPIYKYPLNLNLSNEEDGNFLIFKIVKFWHFPSLFLLHKSACHINKEYTIENNQYLAGLKGTVVNPTPL